MAAEYLERMGDRIRQRREELGLTQEDVARQMPGKVTGARVSLWELGKNRPRDDSLEALADVLQTTVAHFMANGGDKTSTPDLFAVDGGGQLDQLDRIETMLRMIGDKVGVTWGSAFDVIRPAGEGRRERKPADVDGPPQAANGA